MIKEQLLAWTAYKISSRGKKIISFGKAYNSISAMDNLTALKRKKAKRKLVMKRHGTVTTIVQVVTIRSLFMEIIK